MESQLRFADYPADKIAMWLDTERVPARRAWKAFTCWAFERFGDFAEMTGSGGFSGAPKLMMAVAVIRHLRAAGEALPPTVGDLLRLARERGIALDFLPPVDWAKRYFRLAGRPELGRGLDPDLFGPAR